MRYVIMHVFFWLIRAIFRKADDTNTNTTVQVLETT